MALRYAPATAVHFLSHTPDDDGGGAPPLPLPYVVEHRYLLATPSCIMMVLRVQVNHDSAGRAKGADNTALSSMKHGD
jgi:hypothetical protein